MNEVAVSRKAMMRCRSRLMMSQANCSPKYLGGGTEDMGSTVWRLSLFAAHATHDETKASTAESRLSAKK